MTVTAVPKNFATFEIFIADCVVCSVVELARIAELALTSEVTLCRTFSRKPGAFSNPVEFHRELSSCGGCTCYFDLRKGSFAL